MLENVTEHWNIDHTEILKINNLLIYKEPYLD